MTTTTIANLPVLTVMTGSDSIPVDTGSNTYQISGANLKNYFSPIANTSTPGIVALGNGFTVNGSNQVSTSNLYNTNLTQPTQHYALQLDTNGVVILPDQSIINGSTLRAVAGSYAGLTTNDGENSWMWVDAAGAYIATQYNEVGNSNQWTFGNTGNLTLPADATISDFGDTASLNVEGSGRFAQLYWNGNIGNGNPDTGGDYYTWAYVHQNGFTIQYENADTSTNNEWVFGIDGNLTLPTGTPSINYANGSPYGGGGGAAGNAGDVQINVAGNIGADSTLRYVDNGGEMTLYADYLNAPGIFTSDIYAGDGTPSNITLTTSYGNATWTFDTIGTLELPAIAGGFGVIATANAYPELLAYGSGGGFGIHGGPELDWMNSDDPANTFNDESTLRNTLYINGNGLYVGINENGNVGNFSGSLFLNSIDGNLTAPGSVIASTFETSGAAGDLTLTNGNISGANVISATGNISGNYFIGNGSQLTGIDVISQNILPTIQTIMIANTSGTGNASGGQGWANVTVANVIPVTEYGVIITNGTSSQKYATGALGNIPGTEKLNFTTAQTGTQFTVYSYVTSNAGTYYSSSSTGNSGICLLVGTQIALSDGSRKSIEDITYTDKILSWDFDRGCYAETSALWIKISETGSQYNLLTFSDGTTLRTFDQHRIFNKQTGAFTYPMTDSTPIGTVTVNEHGQEITLTNKQVIVDTIEYYNVITDHHMNLFSDSVLTSCRFNNIYPITDMKFVKDARTLRTRDEFENIPDRFFYGLRLAEQTTDIETVEWYVNRLLSTEMLTKSEITV